MFGGNSRKENNVEGVRVQISKSVLERIDSIILRSNLEEGGKLLGRIATNDETGSVLRIEAFIDSGPRTGNSTTHLYPDGEYQEALFRLIECYDEQIEHVGTWHSHHCNGLDRLSDGDIRGYFKNVNHPDYNLNLFLAILITSVRGSRVNKKYYLFKRGVNSYIEIDESKIQVVQNEYPYDDLVKTAEQISWKYRKHDSTKISTTKALPIESEHRSWLRVGKGNRDHDENAYEGSDPLAMIRLQDKSWLMRNFPAAMLVNDKRDDSIRWKWSVAIESDELNVVYSYSEVSRDGRALGRVTTSLRGEEIYSAELSLDADRFHRIEKIIDASVEKTRNNLG